MRDTKAYIRGCFSKILRHNFNKKHINVSRLEYTQHCNELPAKTLMTDGEMDCFSPSDLSTSMFRWPSTSDNIPSVRLHEARMQRWRTGKQLQYKASLYCPHTASVDCLTGQSVMKVQFIVFFTRSELSIKIGNKHKFAFMHSLERIWSFEGSAFR